MDRWRDRGGHTGRVRREGSYWEGEEIYFGNIAESSKLVIVYCVYCLLSTVKKFK